VRIKIHILIRGRIGDDWKDIDTHLKLPVGATLEGLVEAAERAGIPIREALANSPHLADTLMVNGERCPFAEHRGRVLVDDDQVYLLAPLAGG
jgi:molybdopterin converting factor small subunit